MEAGSLALLNGSGEVGIIGQCEVDVVSDDEHRSSISQIILLPEVYLSCLGRIQKAGDITLFLEHACASWQGTCTSTTGWIQISRLGSPSHQRVAR